VNVRQEVKLGAGEDVDFKQYEADMRHLLDTYISAKPSETISDFGDTGLIGLIVRLGAGALDKLPEGIRGSKEAVAETISNNVRKLIIDEHVLNPKYYDRMSELLDGILEARRQGSLEYQEYLAQLLELAIKVGSREADVKYPDWATTQAKRALVDFLHERPELAVEVDAAIVKNKNDAWVGHPMREKALKRAIRRELPEGYPNLDELFELVKAQIEYQ
jgi:type I restriction enzyme R subunit